MKAPHARETFICEWLFDNAGGVDVLNAEFVEEYAQFAECLVGLVNYGALKCPTLGRDLTGLHRRGRLTRTRTGIQGMGGMGFPRWVWSYGLAPHARDIIAEHRKTVKPVTPPDKAGE